MPQTASANSGKNTGKKERGEGPVAMSYVDKAGKNDIKRVSTEVTGVHMIAKGDHGAKTFDVSKLPDGVKNALVVKALSSTLKLYIINHAKPDGSDAIAVADKLYADLAAGKMYVKGEGAGKAGRKFEADIYIAALKQAYDRMAAKKMKTKAGVLIQAMSESKLADAKAKLESMPPKERGAQLKKLLENDFYKKALAELKAKAIDVSGAEVEELAF